MDSMSSPDFCISEYNSQTSNMQKKNATTCKNSILTHERTRISDPFQIRCVHIGITNISEIRNYIFYITRAFPQVHFQKNTCPLYKKKATTCTKINKPQERLVILPIGSLTFLENILFTTQPDFQSPSQRRAIQLPLPFQR